MSVVLLCAAELECDVLPIVLHLAKSDVSDDFRAEAAAVSIYSAHLLCEVMYSIVVVVRNLMR